MNRFFFSLFLVFHHLHRWKIIIRSCSIIFVMIIRLKWFIRRPWPICFPSVNRRFIPSILIFYSFVHRWRFTIEQILLPLIFVSFVNWSIPWRIITFIKKICLMTMPFVWIWSMFFVICWKNFIVVDRHQNIVGINCTWMFPLIIHYQPLISFRIYFVFWRHCVPIISIHKISFERFRERSNRSESTEIFCVCYLVHQMSQRTERRESKLYQSDAIEMLHFLCFSDESKDHSTRSKGGQSNRCGRNCCSTECSDQRICRELSRCWCTKHSESRQTQRGIKSIEIRDDGCGIAKVDLPFVYERFATSKLKQFDDLYQLNTYGFRGEALASLSYAAHVKIISKIAESQCAYSCEYEDGKIRSSTSIKPCAGSSLFINERIHRSLFPLGTNETLIIVEDLFYNNPMRLKMLKSPNEEYTKMVDCMMKLALRNTNVSLTLKRDAQVEEVCLAHCFFTQIEKIVENSSSNSSLLRSLKIDLNFVGWVWWVGVGGFVWVGVGVGVGWVSVWVTVRWKTTHPHSQDSHTRLWNTNSIFFDRYCSMNMSREMSKHRYTSNKD